MKKFNWEEFKDKNNKITVHCKTEEEAKDFCKQMHEHGMKGVGGWIIHPIHFGIIIEIIHVMEIMAHTELLITLMNIAIQS